MIDKKIGVLGGGQLGKMLCQSASRLGLRLSVLEKDDSFPAASVCPDIVYGDFKNYEDVYEFGKQMDILTVEIESVNTDALHKLENEGVKVFPQPSVLDIIKDKGNQKEFYQQHRLPTSHFQLFSNKSMVIEAIDKGIWKYPFVQKSRTDGYDGQGVKVIRNKTDLKNLMDVPCLLEKLVDIEKEISVIVARGEGGEYEAFPVVEMEFHPTANLVEFLFSPSRLADGIQKKAVTLSTEIAKRLEIVGLLAVELFLTKKGEILINEVAPRPHNSGHQTIESNITSQYEQLIRAISGLPLGDPTATGPAVMINLLGGEHTGPATYHNIKDCLAISGAYIHIYGKAESKPFRKMGHATIVDESLEDAIKKAKFIKENLIIDGKR